MKIYHNESGRTMLEMLGVLAIIGIITYGAIAGINYGMRSYKINQTYNEIQEIIQGVEDLYSWSKEYPSGKDIMQAACKNDIFSQKCTNGNTEARVALGEISIAKDGSPTFFVQISLDDEGECGRLTAMEWDAVNVACSNPYNAENKCVCNDRGPSDSIILHFSPKPNKAID